MERIASRERRWITIKNELTVEYIGRRKRLCRE